MKMRTLNKFIFLIFFVLFYGKVNGQVLTQTFIDPCTQEVTLFTIPIQNGTTIVFLNQSRFFTAADVNNGTFTTWVNQVYAQYRQTNPCSQQQGQVTQNQITSSIISSTVQSVVGSIMSSAQSSSTSMGSTSSSGGSNSNDDEDNSGGGGQSGSNNNSSSTGSNGNSNSSGGSSTGGSGGTSGNGGGSGGSGGSGSGGSEGGSSSGGGNTGGSKPPTGGGSGGGGGSSGSGTTGGSGNTNGNTGGNNSEQQGEEVGATTTMNNDAHNNDAGGSEGGSDGGGKGGGKGKGGGNSNPMIISSDLTTAQNLDGSFTPILNLSMSKSSMTGLSSYGATAMIWANLNQFAISGKYTKLYYNKKRVLKYIHNFNITGVYTYGNLLGFAGYSGILNMGKYGVTGFNISGAATIIAEDKSGFYSPSITAFYTRPLKVSKRITMSPELYVMSTPLVYSTKEQVTITDRFFSGFVGSGFDYQITKRFKFNMNYKANVSTNPEIPILSFFLIGSKVNL